MQALVIVATSNQHIIPRIICTPISWWSRVFQFMITSILVKADDHF
jgi:hypothetical protein